MATHAHVPLTRVWAATAVVFLAAALASRALVHRPSPMPSYAVGLVGLLAVGVALALSWRGLGDPGMHAPATRRVLRGAVVLGAVLWVLAMLFPFL